MLVTFSKCYVGFESALISNLDTGRDFLQGFFLSYYICICTNMYLALDVATDIIIVESRIINQCLLRYIKNHGKSGLTPCVTH